jgi:hypothetical protein
MTRSAFLHTLATLLAGTHAVGPLPFDGLPPEARCKAPPRDPAACQNARATAPAACR